MPARYGREVSDNEFTQRVRRHSPSSLMSLIAATSASYSEPEHWWSSPFKKYTPWTLAEIARVALVYGNERRPPAAQEDLLDCCAAHDGMRDPELKSDAPGGFMNFFLRVTAQQLPYQGRLLNEFARTPAIFTHTEPVRPLDVLVEGWQEQLLGCDIGSYVGTAFLLYVSAQRNSGRFDRSWLNQPNFQEVLEDLPLETIESLLDSQFSVTVEAAKESDGGDRLKPGKREFRRFTHNPLRSRPLVEGLAEASLIPVPFLLVQKASPLGLYYEGVGKWGNRFSQDTGSLFEGYVGRQLRLGNGASVFPARKYGRDNRDSVDWIVVFDNLILLVEVKATRPTEAVRVGDSSAPEAIRRSLAHAFGQIDTTASLIRDRNEAFADIPSLPILGLVVTMESFYIANSPPVRSLLPSSEISTVVCSAAELERLVCAEEATFGQILLDHVANVEQAGWSVGSAMEGKATTRNAVLDEGWADLPWDEEEEIEPPP